MDHPLRPICTAWLSKIRLAYDYKQKVFGDDAAEAMRFFNGPHDFLYEPGASRGFITSNEEEAPDPTFRMTLNKVAEMVQIFGPVLYHKNPNRLVTPRKVTDIPLELAAGMPMIQQQLLLLQQQVDSTKSLDAARAQLLEKYLNYTPNELGLKDQARAAIDEALIKGMGTLWVETYRPPGSNRKMIGSFYKSVDNLVIDPDMEMLQDARWIALRCCEPVWLVEEQYGYPHGYLRGNLESIGAQGESYAMDDKNDYYRKRGLTNDLLVYWKVYSKMGMGGRLSGTPSWIKTQLDSMGQYCFIVVCDGVQHPLNLPPAATEQLPPEQLRALVQWPIPFWSDNGWPFEPIIFHPVPRQVWPMSHLKPALGEIKFLDWAYSFLASKIRTACRDFLAVKKSAGEELKSAILSGKDYTLIEIEREHGTINEVVQFLQHPSFNADIYRVIAAVEDNFDKRVGLTELVYGVSARQLRSASEAEIKSENLKVRPDDMSARVEEAMTQLARKEAIAARWHLESEDVQSVLGKVGGLMWQHLIMGADPGTIVQEFEYRIEAGSARKPNRERLVADMVQAVQTLGPILQSWSMSTGEISALNNLLGDWAESMDLDPSRYLLTAPPPQPPPPEQQGPPPEGQEPSPEGQAA